MSALSLEPRHREAAQRSILDDSPERRDSARILSLRGSALRALRPPQKIDTAAWIESNVTLPAEASDSPGLVTLYPYQRDIVTACETEERVTFQKCARIGATTLAVGIVGSYAANDPSNIMIVQPTEDDSRDFVVSMVEPIFAASRALAGLLRKEEKRSTIQSRRFPGGWLKCVGAAPRNMRRHFVKKLFLDEVDGYPPAPGEGDIATLAINRTRTARDRLVFMASTPTDAETSRIAREYETSDKRIYEICCPGCGEFFEPKWAHVKWDKTPEGEHLPETAHLVCPHNGCVIEESQKPDAVARGRWRKTAPNVTKHAGFKCSALISTIHHARWGQIVREFLASKDDPDALRVWTNTLLGDTFHDQRGEGLEDSELSKRAEAFDLDHMPTEVRVLTLGVDVQAYGLELVTLGHSATQMFALDYRTIHGAPTSDETWKELDEFIKRTFTHPLGGRLGFDAVAIDEGDGNTTDIVRAFARPRFGRRVVSVKGHDGDRPLIDRSSKAGLYIVGVDGAKTRLYGMLQSVGRIRFSQSLPARAYEELCSERRVTFYKFGQPRKRWERIKGMRAEYLDGFVYSMAVRELVGVDLTARENTLRQITQTKPAQTRFPSKWMEGER